MEVHYLDYIKERCDKIRVCEKKLCEAFGNYCSCLGEMHKSWIREQSEKAYEEAVHRWQDLEALKYDPKEKWDLNFNDYNE